MKAKLWQVKFQSKKYSGEHPEVTVNASNACMAIHKALKKGKGQTGVSLREVVDVEWLATED